MWKVTVKDLMKEKRKVVEGLYEVDTVELHTGTYPVVGGSFKVKMVLTYANDKIVLGGFARGHVERPCDRCLKVSHMYVDGVIEAVYTFEERHHGRTEEIKSLVNEIRLTGEVIDLEERILEAIVSAAPDVFVCSENCKGLCPHCGADLNEHPDHSCAADEGSAVDPRLLVLLEIKKRQEG